MSNEWQIGKGEWRDNSPLGERMQDFITTFPEYVIYIRKDHRFKCPKHWSNTTETPTTLDVNCDCWGFGEKVTASIVPCRLSRGEARMDHRDGDLKQMPGFIGSWRDIVHFPRAVCPETNDIVMCCTWNVKFQDIPKVPRPRPIDAHSIYLIRELNPQFQRELAWQSCGMKGFDIESDHIQKLINLKFDNLKVLEVDSSWPQKFYW